MASPPLAQRSPWQVCCWVWWPSSSGLETSFALQCLEEEDQPDPSTYRKEGERPLVENLRQSTALLNDPERCVRIGDRESDIYELFCTAQQMGTHFLVRTCVDRLAGDGTSTIGKEMKQVRVQGLHRIKVRDKNGEPSEAVLEIRYCRLVVLPPIGKQKNYPKLILTAIHAQERRQAAWTGQTDWKLLTTCRWVSPAPRGRVQKLVWYSMRWKIETFLEDPEVRRLQGRGGEAANGGMGCKSVGGPLHPELANLLTTMINRAAPDAPVEAGIHQEQSFGCSMHWQERQAHPQAQKTFSTYLTKVAQLGGYLARATDSPPGNLVMWRGLSVSPISNWGHHWC